MSKFFLVLFSINAILLGCIQKRKLTSNSAILYNEGLTQSSIGPVTDALMPDLLKQHPHYFDSLLSNNDEYQIQIIYTEINRTKRNKARFTDHYFNINPRQYFYPASTVKFPVAILALQKLNELNIEGLDRNTTMITESGFSGQTDVYNDPTSIDGRPTVAHYIKKILLVSDNDAFNRLYEFLGQEYINNRLHDMGYTNTEIIHRLNISLSEVQNRYTNPVKFYAAPAASLRPLLDIANKVIYEKPLEKSSLVYANRTNKAGKGYYTGELLINEPFDFSKKNKMALTDLHVMMKSIFFPRSVKRKQRFKITADDLLFLQKHMSMLPHESKNPAYDSARYPDNYAKVLLYGSEKRIPDSNIRIFNKTGSAYGFLIDVAYIVDFKNRVEFMISTVIHCNSDGIYNDDKYDYDAIGYPFMKHLGEVIYEYELKRERKHPPDLTDIKFTYKE